MAKRTTWLAGLALLALLLSSNRAPRAAAEPSLCRVAGVWLGGGEDVDGSRWNATMLATQSGTSVEVHIVWTGINSSSGSESARGTIDCATRRLELRTVSVTAPLAYGLYHAQLDPAFRAMRGTWDGQNVVPGRFWARRP